MSRVPLHVIRCYLRRPPCPGGMEKHIAALSREQRKLGVRVTDVYNEGEIEGEGVKILVGLILCRVRPAVMRDFLFYLVAIIRLRHLRLEKGHRVIHVHGDWSAFLFARMLRHALAADLLVASIHGTIRRAYLMAWVLGGVDLVFSTGKNIAKRINRIIYMPSAPSDIFFTQPEIATKTDIILVGSLVNVKNYDLLLNVAERLSEIRFAVIGTGPEGSRLRNTATLRGITNIDWRGEANPSEVRDAIAAAKVFLNLSYEEGTPTAAIEAMAVGTPVVLTPSNDYVSLLGNGEAGVVLDGWDIEEIVLAIRDLLENEDRRKAMSVRARERAAGERWNVKARQVTDSMNRAIDWIAS